jgi:hypothetical protein
MKTGRLIPFKIEIAAEFLNDLQFRLKNTRWSGQVDGTNWETGTDLNYLKELVACWRGTYDWRKQETALNQFAHFKTEVDDIGIHFIHERGKGRTHSRSSLGMGTPTRFIVSRKSYPCSPIRFIRWAAGRRFRCRNPRPAGLRIFRPPC